MDDRPILSPLCPLLGCGRLQGLEGDISRKGHKQKFLMLPTAQLLS
jgi:hypothetical protein